MDKDKLELQAYSLVHRLQEPSSWAGISAALIVFGINIDPSLWQKIVMAGSGLAGLAAFFVPEGTKK